MALSKSAVDRLGERLRDGIESEADWVLLEDLRAERHRQLSAVVQRLRDELGIEVTSRVKTTNTLVEKLRRERMRLSQMDDIAGARLRIGGTRLDQDDLVDRILDVWPRARVKDRRARPVHGYRAVHVIPTVEGWPLEIQVRTDWQDRLANLLERLADAWGRQIRYGGAPEEAVLRPVPSLGVSTRSGFVELVHSVADLTARIEVLRVKALEGALPEAHHAELATVERECDEIIAMLAGQFESLNDE